MAEEQVIDNGIVEQTTVPEPQSEQTGVVSRPIFVVHARVQYVGDDLSAFKGQTGKVAGYTSDNKVAVLFDGAGSPIKLQEVDLIEARDPDEAKPDALMTSKQPRFRFIANTSGGILHLNDLRNETEDEGIALDPGEVIDLLQSFTVEQINRAQSLPKLAQRLSENNGLSYITVLSSMEDELPEGTIVIPLGMQHKAGTMVEAKSNLFDDKLDEHLAKEEERNNRIAAMARTKRHTSQHGQASSRMGR